MSNISKKTEAEAGPWRYTSWEGNELLYLRRSRAWSLREKLIAIEGMGEVADRLGKIRAVRGRTPSYPAGITGG